MRAILGCGLAAFLVFTVATGAEEKFDAKKLIGKWEPSDKKNNVVLEFLKEGKLTVAGKSEKGKDFKIDGTYKLNGDKLELVLTINGKEKADTATILKLTDDELITEDSAGKKDTLKKLK